MGLTAEQIQKFTNDMRNAASIKDVEISHQDMDEILLNIAEAVGCTELVEIFNKSDRYYA